MPTYEYTCEACKADWELEQRMSEDAVKVCPKCGELKAKRLISGGNFMLKGDGWYKDLYHKPAAAKKTTTESTTTSSSDSSSSSSSSTSSSSDSGSSSSSSASTSKPSGS